jgi:FtsZ-binding cell division protein ZapB
VKTLDEENKSIKKQNSEITQDREELERKFVKLSKDYECMCKKCSKLENSFQVESFHES